MNRSGLLSIIFFSLVSVHVMVAQTDTIQKIAPAKKDHWYDKLSFRGYTQLRYNRLGETNKDLKLNQDKSVGDKGGFLIRRGRLVLCGDVHPRIYVYIQNDFGVTAAASISQTVLHYTGLRDAYFDLALDSAKTFRIRFGQSKVPFGFENMQSSQNRLPLDRADGLNSAVSGERDLGAFFYWAPVKRRKLFKSLVDDGLKGSGDYGCFGFGVFNGQTINKAETNNNLHVVGRFTWPFNLKNQTFEVGLQGYTGFYTLESVSAGTKVSSDKNYIDTRYAATFVIYPKPFGLLAEYNMGKGPVYDASGDSVKVDNLEGGFITINYMFKLKRWNQVIIPYARAQYFSGGFKTELDAAHYKVNDYEFGIEYQFYKNFEITVAYLMANRRIENKPNETNYQSGNLLRLQLQFNY
ncbi:MAG TPA: porin [Bacteroidia bacterium]|nr:porin [Bacteroidia bacterium]